MPSAQPLLNSTRKVMRHQRNTSILHLGLIFTIALAGCGTASVTTRATYSANKFAARDPHDGDAGALEQTSASRVILHLNILEATLPLIVPAHFDQARTRLIANTSSDEQMLLLIVIDFGGKNANHCLKNLGSQERQPYPRKCRRSWER